MASVSTHNRCKRLWRDQGGLCHWCHLPMLRHTGEEVPHGLSVTVDHLVPREIDPHTLLIKRKARPYVGAHRICNNARTYRPDVTEATVRRIERALASLKADQIPVLPTPRPQRQFPRGTPKRQYDPTAATTPLAALLEGLQVA